MLKQRYSNLKQCCSNVETTPFQPEHNIEVWLKSWLLVQHWNVKSGKLKFGYLTFKQHWNNVKILTLGFGWKPDVETMLEHQDSYVEIWVKTWRWNNVRILTLKFGWKPDVETTLNQHQDSDIEIWLKTWRWNNVEATLSTSQPGNNQILTKFQPTLLAGYSVKCWNSCLTLVYSGLGWDKEGVEAGEVINRIEPSVVENTGSPIWSTWAYS